ncbi:MAG: hypothetical protein NVS2B2_39250 [Ktedonobacteraceae bacterium]
MNPKSSNNLSKSLLIIGCGAVPLTAFLFQATPILIITVALPLLSLVTELLLLLVLIAMVTGLVIGVGWVWTMFDDERRRRHYWHERRKLDLAQRRRHTVPMPMTRATDPTLPVPTRQLRPPLRRPNKYRPEI